jgi:hypothetical protein
VSRGFQKCQLVAYGIGKHRLQNEAFLLPDQFLPQFGNHRSSFIGINVQFAGYLVRVEEAQTGRFEVGVVKSRFPGAIRSGHGDQDWALVQNAAPGWQWSRFCSLSPGGCLHRAATRTGWNLRLINRPVVRLPLASILTSKPPGAGS